MLLEQMAGYTIPEKEERLKDFCAWYEQLFISENTPVERFLHALPKLCNTSKLKKGQHYHIKAEGFNLFFTFDMASCLAIYNEEFVNGDFSKYLDKRLFGEELKNSKYFVERKNHRFNCAKGQAYSYTLNLAGHDVVPYIEVWAGISPSESIARAAQKNAEATNESDN